MKGGARIGAGRKPVGSTKVLVNFKLERSTVARQRASIPRGRMTAFVEQAITRALDAAPVFTSRSQTSR